MHGFYVRITLALLLIIVAILACNYPSVTPTQDLMVTQVAATLTALAPGISVQPSMATFTGTTIPIPANTVPPSITPTPENPVVIHDALCNAGPGDVYEVVSSVKTGTQVELIGVGSVSGWYIINNPIYHDPCWIAAANLKIDPGFNLSTLRVFNPPSTPTPEATQTPVPTT